MALLRAVEVPLCHGGDTGPGSILPGLHTWIKQFQLWVKLEPISLRPKLQLSIVNYKKRYLYIIRRKGLLLSERRDYYYKNSSILNISSYIQGFKPVIDA